MVENDEDIKVLPRVESISINILFTDTIIVETRLAIELCTYPEP